MSTINSTTDLDYLYSFELESEYYAAKESLKKPYIVYCKDTGAVFFQGPLPDSYVIFTSSEATLPFGVNSIVDDLSSGIHQAPTDSSPSPSTYIYERISDTQVSFLMNLMPVGKNIMYPLTYGFKTSDLKVIWKTENSSSTTKTNIVSRSSNQELVRQPYTSIDLSHYDTSQVTSFQEMFAGCVNITSLDLSGFDFTALNTLGTDGWYDSQENMATDARFKVNMSPFDVMFWGCESLETLNLSGWNWVGGLGLYYQDFMGCTNLKTVTMNGCSESIVNEMKTVLSELVNEYKYDMTDWSRYSSGYFYHLPTAMSISFIHDGTTDVYSNGLS